MLKIVLLCLGLSVINCLHSQQHLQVLLRGGEPVIAYPLPENQTSYALYKRFGMDDSMFLRLNKIDSTGTTNDDMVYLSIKTIMLDKCDGDSCTELFYLATEGDNFKTIGNHFGNLNPYTIKRFNPQLETITPGKPVMVGYLPQHLLDNSSTAKPKASGHKKNAGDTAAAIIAATSHNSKDSVNNTQPYHGPGIYKDEFKNADTAFRIGKASNFKSFGGWYDGKFYILVKEYAPGKVVKVTNLQNGLFVFAKVVGALPDMKSEKRLLARLNNAACAALDIWDDNDFDIQIRE